MLYRSFILSLGFLNYFALTSMLSNTHIITFAAGIPAALNQAQCWLVLGAASWQHSDHICRAQSWSLPTGVPVRPVGQSASGAGACLRYFCTALKFVT